jgi:putative transcriptional regulator
MTKDHRVLLPSDLKGLRIRAASAQLGRMLSAFGAEPKYLPGTAVAAGLDQGNLDGTLLPYEVIPTFQLQTRIHQISEFGGDRGLFTVVHILAMSRETIIVLRRETDKELVRVLPDGREKPLADPGPLPERSESAISAAAMSDADDPPRTPEREKKLKRFPQVKVLRKALGLTQDAFAAYLDIPLATLRDWEQGKSEPDSGVRAYLMALDRARKLKFVPQVKVMRKALGLTEEAFAAHFDIPLATLRDWEQRKVWEQGKSEPDSCARAYRKVILWDPKAVTEALETYVRPGEDMAHGRDTFRSIQNLIRVRDLFWREWDPIGVNQFGAPKDEYDRYADEAYAMLMHEGHSANEIADYLYRISSEHMGLRYDRLKALAAKVAGKLAALKPEFEAASDEPS